MLLGDGERPRASRAGAVASETTNGLVIDARYAISKLWEERQDDIKAACAPQLIDEMDCYGYLLADLLGRPLLHVDDAGDVGRRAHVQQGRAATKWKEEQRKADDAVRRATKAAEVKPALAPRIAPAETAGAKACAAVLTKPYDLKLPARTVGKRVRELTAQEAAVAAAAAALAEAEAAAAEAAAVAANGVDEVRRTKAREAAADRELEKLQTPAELMERPTGTPSECGAWLRRAEAWQRSFLPPMSPPGAFDRLFDGIIDQRVKAAQTAAQEVRNVEEAAEEAAAAAEVAAAAVETARRELRRVEGAADAAATATAATATEAEAASSGDDTSGDDASVASEDIEWEWDEGISVYELYHEMEDMVLAVSLTAAGLARCVDCAHRLVHAARRSRAQEAYDGIGPWYYVWRQSRPFDDTSLIAEKLLDAVAAEPRCARCASGADGILTAAGEEAIVEVSSIVTEAYTMASLEVAAVRRRGC